MTTFSDPAAAVQHHTLTFKICSHDRTDPVRVVDVHASPEEIARLVADGYLVRERLFSPEQVERMRRALDEVAEREVEGGAIALSASRRFGGLFLRHLMDKHPVFLEMFRYKPTLSVARAVLGPQVQVRPMTGRISYPDESRQETHWHFHQRCIPIPTPAFFARPHVIDCLIYLDDVTDANGPLCVLPGSHQWVHAELTPDDYGDRPDQVVLRLPAGSCVIVHGGLWHRALPNGPQGTVRRLLILPYAAAWLQLPTYGPRPQNGLLQTLYQDADFETLELLGEPEGLY